MVNFPKIIGVGGVSTCGKDTFCNALISRFPNLKKFGFANKLKIEVRSSLIEKLNIDIFNCTPEQKEIARPYLVEYGRSKRNESRRYWVDKLIPEIQEYLRASPDNVVLISDVRFYESEIDEVPWLKKENNGILVHVSQYKIVNGQRVFKKPANSEEEFNDPILQKNANYRIIWEEVNKDHFKLNNNDDYLFRSVNEHIEEFVKWVKR